MTIASLVLMSRTLLSIRRFDRQDLDVPIREIDPVVDGVSGEHADLHTAASPVVFMIVRITIRRRTQPDEVIDQPCPHSLRNYIEDGERLQIYKKAVAHESGYSE